MRVLFLSLIFLATAFTSISQRYAYVDTDYILETMPEYKKAQKKLDELSKKWQKEIETRYKIIEKREKKLKEEALLMPDKMKKKKKAEIKSMREAAVKLQKKRFGVKGDLFKQREALIKPIQDRIFEAIQSVANRMNISFIFDKANQSTLLFADSKFDRSDNVLIELGVNPNKNKSGNSGK